MARKQCFVIMPFGDKPDVDGTILEFDKIHKYLIEPAVTDAGLDCVRCDQIEQPGWIHAKMIERIYQADVAVVDISTLNANVFYELGVRHALKPAVTILIRHRKTRLPFNLNGLNAIEYDHTDLESVAKTKDKIGVFVREALKSGRTDSLVHEVLPLRIGTTSRPIARTETFAWALKAQPERQLCVTTGDIQRIKGIDIWVNSENTQMQMARWFDGSVSGAIRYLGAEKNAAGLVTQDLIADELTRIVGHQTTVAPATVIATGSGVLARTHGVKQIIHAASVAGAIGKGYLPIANVSDCVANALALADSPELQPLGASSILFPLLGGGTARGDLKLLVAPLIEAALEYLRANPASTIRRVHFMAYSEAELAACCSVLDSLPDLASVPAGG